MDSNDREYKNDDITVYWKPAKCIHATTCYKELVEVFNPRNRPWVDMKGAPTERIIEVVDKCPTQALYYRYNKDIEKNPDAIPQKKEDAPEKKTEIKVMKDGPLVVRGDFKVIDEEGNELKTMKMISLCRCGKSSKMPFCDGTHRKFDFQG